MIDLTPIDIRKKKGDFPRAMRGYDVADVDLFLDLVADRVEELANHTRRLEDRLTQLEAQLEEYRQRERALNDALVSAQELREQVRHQSAKEAELLRREAEIEAEKIRVAALKAREQEEDLIRRLKARRMQLLRTFRSFLERELAELAVMAEGMGGVEAVEPAMAAARRSSEPATPRRNGEAKEPGGES